MQTQLKEKKKRPIWKKIAFGLISFILAITILGASFEAIAGYQVVKNNPPEGKLVDVGGFKLHLHKQGKGGPTIILETGSGASSTSWLDIPEELSKFGTVVTYDRGGYGWSEKADAERTGENIVRELYKALKKEKIEGPYILVGHSLGGMYARLFAQTYQDEVGGVVLLDARTEDYSKETDPILLDAGVDPILMGSSTKNVMALLKNLGIIRLMGDSILKEIPKELREVALNVEFRPKYFAAKEDELRNMTQLEDSIRNKSLEDIPLKVVTHGIPIDGTVIGISEADSNKMEDIWQEQQKQMLTLSTNSELIVAENSGHAVMHDEPDLVIETVKSMINR
ncbi:alpha/beta fold hydrolase [Bacillus sp. FJAT-29814]|uniref:alpha/beta fold hydrolase n=1 Tax=Bacillus sp. FJAT-29814 TaxID=1729688 RepID=UPI0008378D70|nr:alpha/beta hydrolase [Bacillus sp. FJAT-29814]